MHIGNRDMNNAAHCCCISFNVSGSAPCFLRNGRVLSRVRTTVFCFGGLTVASQSSGWKSSLFDSIWKMLVSIIHAMAMIAFFLLALSLFVRVSPVKEHSCQSDSKTDMSVSISERMNGAYSSVMPVTVAIRLI